ncbi:hypothetical protein DSM106972_094720 [Dulcicalothrix desertica PCC 7102]|uniref:HTH cro/C1-type domain-containing protein n=1 Tax=Dulcicalothrix desertica PCC 7102 TaxID=232991 RepID=A0A3S1A5G4_9CYAN|nr:hypothetical protein [Dulcicalothrix desertica]RUS94001.1 hypothetical protein DSM106972_094720 [Dulcicalothrix desertica PCC 7102]TWH62682.1 hypothetical protein CAL7102_00189 [Dulcicalothrix desertica PCC 7102]
MDSKILNSRFKKLGWTTYKLAQKVNRIRVSIFGEESKKTSSLVTSIAKILDNPNNCSFKNVEAAIRAMGGEVIIRWQSG